MWWLHAPVLVQVSSDFAGPLTLYTVSEGVATRLGDVQGGRPEQFRLAAARVPTGGLYLIAVPVTGSGCGPGKADSILPLFPAAASATA